MQQGKQTLPAPSGNLSATMRGTWWLLSREDYTENGELRIDPVLGANPVGIISYADTHFAAQFMKRDRSENGAHTMVHAGQNNTSAVNGYDAYFGTYEVDEQTGQVRHTLIGSVTPANIGMTVVRDLRATDDTLTIQLATTATDGEPIIRTLTWKRISTQR